MGAHFQKNLDGDHSLTLRKELFGYLAAFTVLFLYIDIAYNL